MHCNPQGRIISFFRLFYYQDAYYLSLPRNMVAITWDALKKYAIFYRVNLSDASETFFTIGCYGANLKKTLKTLSYTLPESDGVLSAKDLVCINISSNSTRSLFLATRNSSQMLWNKLKTRMLIATIDEWRYQDIDAKIPTIYPQTTGRLLPQDIGLHALRAINLNKGCYTGQEIIARMYYRGKQKKALFQGRLKSPSLPQPGSDIYSETTNQDRLCGTLIEYSHESLDTYRLLFVADESDATDGKLFMNQEDRIFLEVLV